MDTGGNFYQNPQQRFFSLKIIKRLKDSDPAVHFQHMYRMYGKMKEGFPFINGDKFTNTTIF